MNVEPVKTWGRVIRYTSLAVGFVFALSAIKVFVGQVAFDGAMLGAVAYLLARDVMGDR